MKKNKMILPVLTFIMGVLFSGTLFAFLSFTKIQDTGTPQKDLTVITGTEANELYKNHVTNANTAFTPFKGFFLDILQYNAMSEIAKNSTSLSGFRIYLGKDKNKVNVGIVVGVDEKGSDATSASDIIYMTSSLKSGPCPYICDVNSTIISK